MLKGSKHYSIRRLRASSELQKNEAHPFSIGGMKRHQKHCVGVVHRPSRNTAGRRRNTTACRPGAGGARRISSAVETWERELHKKNPPTNFLSKRKKENHSEKQGPNSASVWAASISLAGTTPRCLIGGRGSCLMLKMGRMKRGPGPGRAERPFSHGQAVQSATAMRRAAAAPVARARSHRRLQTPELSASGRLPLRRRR